MQCNIWIVLGIVWWINVNSVVKVCLHFVCMILFTKVLSGDGARGGGSVHINVNTIRVVVRYVQGGLVGVLQKQPSVIMLTFTVGPGPYADFYSGARPPC